MTIKIAALIFAAAVLLSASGCAWPVAQEYYYSARYSDSSDALITGQMDNIKNYYGLIKAISAMVNSHQESATLKIIGYDGEISEDLTAACLEVKSSTAVGAYAVEYISYDLSRIVSYYEADIYITFKRTAEQINSVVNVGNGYLAREAVYQAVRDMKDTLVIQVNGEDITTDDVMEYFDTAFLRHPLELLAAPEMKLEDFKSSGTQTIYEMTFSYPKGKYRLREMKEKIAGQAEEILGKVTGEAVEDRAFSLAQQLSELCEYDPTSEIRNEIYRSDSGMGGTAYGVLLEGVADSRGFALTFYGLCDMLGIDCIIVQGRLQNEDHWWNIIKVENEFYHVDCSLWRTMGAEEVFMRSDADISDEYWWAGGDYPICEGVIDYFSTEPEDSVGTRPTTSPTPTREPQPTPSPTPTKEPTPTAAAEPEPPEDGE